MQSELPPALEERLLRLEQRLERLEVLAKAAAQPPPPAATPDPSPAARKELPLTVRKRPAAESPQAAPPVSLPPSRLDTFLRSENWLQITGIVMLLFALSFLFKYAIDQGWLVPAVRVAIGFVLGAALLFAGLRRSTLRAGYRQLFMAGGLVAWYITGSATWQLYELLPWGVVMAFMVGTTALALWLALRERQSGLALIGTIGGLLTPLLINTPDGSMAGLAWFTVLTATVVAALSLWMGWSGLLCFLIPGSGAILYGTAWSAESADRTPILAALALWAIATWLIPTLTHTPHLLPRLSRGAADTARWRGWFLPAATFSAPLILYGLLVTVLQRSVRLPLPDERLLTNGWIALGMAAIALGAALWLDRQETPNPWLVPAQLVAGVLLATRGLFLLEESTALSRPLLLLLLGLLLVALHLAHLYMARRPGPFAGAGAIATITPVFLAASVLINHYDAGVFRFSADMSATLALLAMLAGVAWFLSRHHDPDLHPYRAPLAMLYGGLTHAGVLAWLAAFFAVRPENGQAWVTAAWGVYAVILLGVGVWQNRPMWRTAALATLALIVAKLFLVDLTFVSTVVRIILFFVFGLLYLGLSRLLLPRRDTPG